jgi:hypothetical protein
MRSHATCAGAGGRSQPRAADHPFLARLFLLVLAAATCLVVLAFASVADAWTPKAVKADQNVFMPGSQTGSVNLESAGRCDNCHGGYDQAVEPAFNQYGSMMSQAARDPLWLACLTVGAQDSIWALGNPNATDICIRCHTPTGWLGGRSDPTNTSALAGSDFEGVSCDACHRMVDPLAQLGQPEVAADTGAAATAAAETKARDLTILGALKLFDGTTPFLNGTTKLPTYYGDGSWPNYTESSAGQYYVDTGSSKSGPFSDTVARHGVYYSRFHKSKRFCATCHDVSNPILANVTMGAGTPERQAGGSYFHVERTYSEFALSAYGQAGGSASTIPGIATAAKCQDCHLRDVTGKGCNKMDAPLRTDLPLHDMTGGNVWMTGILASAVAGETGYDAYNYAILSGTKYPGAKIDITGLQSVGPQLRTGKQRALQQLQQAATIQTVGETTATLTLRVRNNTGHKLISGFPEGRRMFLYVTFYDENGRIVGEVNPYEVLATTKDGNGNEVYVGGGDLDVTHEALVWGAEMSSTLTGETESLHFALATGRYKDNRIPPKGFDAAKMADRLAQPVWHGAAAPDYFTPTEYAGGYDELSLAKPAGATQWYATLYYQTTSKDYVEFLRDEIKGAASTLSSPTPSGEAQAYIAQTDSFFASIKGWGDAIYDLWLHNGGATPVKMTELGTAARQGMMASIPSVQMHRIPRRAGGISLRWPVVPKATGYRVYRLDAATWTLLTTTPVSGVRVPASTGVTYGVAAYKVLPDSTVVEGPQYNVVTGA